MLCTLHWIYICVCIIGAMYYLLKLMHLVHEISRKRKSFICFYTLIHSRCGLHTFAKFVPLQLLSVWSLSHMMLNLTNLHHRAPSDSVLMGKMDDCMRKSLQILWERQEGKHFKRLVPHILKVWRLKKQKHPSGTWVLSVSAAPLPSGGTPVLVLVLSLFAGGILDPVCPGAAPSTPVLPWAHPWQRGPPRFIVTMGRVAGEAQRHAGIWRQGGHIQWTDSFQTSAETLFRTIVEVIAGLVLLFTRLVLFMPPGSSVCYCRTHIAVCGHGAARSLGPPTWNHHMKSSLFSLL